MAKFEHDTARPVEGYAAPQLHTHAVIFNVTERENGRTRALQERGFFDSQQFATAVYQSELTFRLSQLGYEIEAGRSAAPEIKGYTQEYLDASSPRSRQIREQLERTGYSGPEAAQIAAHSTRDRKQTLTAAEVLGAHREMAARFGNQPQQVVSLARERYEKSERQPQQRPHAREAVTFARDSIFEREAVADERAILRDALRRGMGEASYRDVRAEFNLRREAGDFRSVDGMKHDSGRSFTTPETITAERANVRYVLDGRNAVEPIMSAERALEQARTKTLLNDSQRRVIEEVLNSSDRIHGLQGLAGTGKTTTLETIRQGAEASGYAVEGFAPTSKATGQLREAGIDATTLQGFLARGHNYPGANPSNRHLYMLDESSLASTKQMRSFLTKLKPDDRVLVIGDTRQHQGVDAGRPFQQMQEAGMQTSQLDKIVRQKDPELLRAVQHLANDETTKGIAMLAKQGRITEIANSNNRVAAIARDYAARPENTIIVSPDNRSRQEINEAVRVELRKAGVLAVDGQVLRTLTHRSDLTGADRSWAARYNPGDVLQYTTGSKAEGIERNSFSVVRSIDPRANNIAVEVENGSIVRYDPRRLRGVNVFREVEREFAIGDRLQWTAPNKELGVANRDLGTVVGLEDGKMTLRMDGNPTATTTFVTPITYQYFNPHWHLGYVQAVNFTIEQQLAANLLLRAAYVGDRGVNLQDNNEQNPAIYGPGATVANTNNRRALYPNFASMIEMNNAGFSHYNALQMTLERRMSSGFSFVANYTRSKTTDNQSSDQQLTLTNPDPFDPSFNNGLANEDVPNAFFLSGVGELPTLKSAPRWVRAIAGGWGLSGILTWANGQPFTVTSGQDNSRSGVNLDRADLVPGVTLLPAGPNSRSQELNAYFNTSAFTVNALGTFGDSPRNPLRNPNYFNVDAGLQRMFPITERIHFKFRVEEFNAANHVHFNQPGANVSAPTTFGKITGAGDPRILQLVGRLEF
jgi:hypothetical protein